MLQAYEGYLEKGRFYPIGTSDGISGRRRVIVTVLDEPIQDPKEDEKAFWAEFHRMAAESADENHVFEDEAFSRRPSGRGPINFNEEV